jgi:hypothetical protein
VISSYHDLTVVVYHKTKWYDVFHSYTYFRKFIKLSLSNLWVFDSIVYLCNGCSAIEYTGWCYYSRSNECKFRNCEIAFITITYDCLSPKATYCALSSTVQPDLCISYGISDVDLTYNYISIIMHVWHHIILHIAIDWCCMKICLCSLRHIS